MNAKMFDLRESVIVSWLISKFSVRSSKSNILFGLIQGLIDRIDRLLLKLYEAKPFSESVILSLLLKASSYFGLLFAPIYTLMMTIPDEKWKNLYFVPIVMLSALVYLFSAERRRLTPQRIEAGLDGFDSFFLLFHIFFITATVFSQRVELSLSYFVLSTLLFLWTFFVINYFTSLEDVERLSKGIAWAVFIQSAFALVLMFVLPKESNALFTDTNITQGFTERIDGSFGNPNILAEFLVLGIPFLFAALLNSRSKWRSLWILAILPVLFVLVKTGTRSAWLAALFSIALFFVMKSPKSILWIVILGVVAAFMIPNHIYLRFMSIFNSQDSSMGMRLNIYRSTLYMIGEHVFGIGLGSELYQSMLKDYRVFGLPDFAHSHNTFLQIWVEQGILALIVFVIFCISITIKAFWYNNTDSKTVDNPDERRLNHIMLAAFVSFVAIMVVGLTEHIWFYFRIQIALWTNLCVLFICFRLKHKFMLRSKINSEVQTMSAQADHSVDDKAQLSIYSKDKEVQVMNASKNKKETDHGGGEG